MGPVKVTVTRTHKHTQPRFQDRKERISQDSAESSPYSLASPSMGSNEIYFTAEINKVCESRISFCSHQRATQAVCPAF